MKWSFCWEWPSCLPFTNRDPVRETARRVELAEHEREMARAAKCRRTQQEITAHLAELRRAAERREHGTTR